MEPAARSRGRRRALIRAGRGARLVLGRRARREDAGRGARSRARARAARTRTGLRERVSEREHDVVLFGATGFTGALTAHYLAQGPAAGTRWALAGRNRAKLEALREELSAVDPGLSELPLLHAD